MNLKREAEDLDNKIFKIKRKRFSGLPDSLIEMALKKAKDDEKEAKAILRKYFGVFLTNKVLKADDEKILRMHISSKNRHYKELYKKIFNKKAKSVIDIGCGVNGFSYSILFEEAGRINYVGIEAIKQLVDKMNKFFDSRGYCAKAIWGDVFDFDKIKKIVKNSEKPAVIFMFNLIDALEFFAKDSSQKLINEISHDSDRIVLSFSLKSLSGKKRFEAQRKWIIHFIEDNFEILDDFEISGERFLIFKNKKN